MERVGEINPKVHFLRRCAQGSGQTTKQSELKVEAPYAILNERASSTAPAREKA